MAPRFVRRADNPILTATDLPFDAHSVFNPGAALLPDGGVALVLRVENRSGHSSLHIARSADGATSWQIDERPLLAPNPLDPSCEWGFEDARVSHVPELGVYVITCTAYGRTGPSVYMATTPDFEQVEHVGVVLPPEDKNAAVLPRRFDGEWVLLHRPVVPANGSADIWMSRSRDMESWRHHGPVMLRRTGGWWDAARIGIGPPPIETDAGWVLLYHGVRTTMSGAIYRVGAALLDLDHPWLVTKRLDDHLLAPEASYERVGDVGNVVFPNGCVVRDGRVDLYYGAADTSVCMASMPLGDIVDALLDAPDAGR
jgi:predicted GH43/DUF377 family glycosyl hydrolase